tara:strand:+ start:19 stop:798 length:780 start_codon:yes stop_codon:yes gene_type:complete
MKKVILLDMDGTITPPRKPIQDEMIVQLNSMINDKYELGIVSGSDIDYMDEQLGRWDKWAKDCKMLHKYPVNGTKDLDMKSQYTEADWQWLIDDIEAADHRMRLSLGGQYIRIPNEIIEYRGSAINWCPIGRDASDKMRKRFVGLDYAFDIRINFMNQLKSRPLFHSKTVIKLGGQTSFDIYPTGWDKSYVFKDFQGFERIYFIGDKCESMGNDYEGYVTAGDYGISTDGPATTCRILSEILKGSISYDAVSPEVATSS